MGCSYPLVDTVRCIDCGLCALTCPFVRPADPLQPKACYAAIHKDDGQRMASSSGGVFVALARQTITRGGVVFGAVFTEDWRVRHTHAETMECVLPMMGSKYVQSDTNHTFLQAKCFLEAGREVLFTGTPCQIAGLKHYLKKDYPTLLAVEVICHGVPAPAVWKSYIQETLLRLNKNNPTPDSCKKNIITGIAFRNKSRGWKNYRIEFRTTTFSQIEVASTNQYMRTFLRDWNLRPSCYACKAKSGASQADMTIGDFWGIDKTDIIFDDDKGVSCVVCRSQKGQDAIKNLEQLTLISVDYPVIYKGNPNLEKSVTQTISARRFRRLFPHHGFYRTVDKLEHLSIVCRGAGFLLRSLKAFKKVLCNA